MKRLVIGCHLSSSKGYLNMGQEALSIDGNTFQFFTRNPQGGSKAKPLDLEDINKYNQFAKEHEFGYIIAHAPYTMNLAGEENIRAFGKQMMKDDLYRLQYVYQAYYNFHPGSHKGLGEEIGIQNIIESLNEIITSNEGVMVLLETMAGKGNEIGRTFKEIRKIIDGVNFPSRFGVTIDTCHIHDGGYDLTHLDDVLSEFNNVVGIERLKAIHLNDSLNEREAHKDRHARIGEGKIGYDVLYQVTRHPLLKDLPFILETPNDLEGYAREIQMMRKEK